MKKNPRKELPRLVFIVSRKYNQNYCKQILNQFKRDTVFWIRKKKEIKYDMKYQLITSHPLGPRKYLYMFLAYLYIMFNVSNRIVVASDNFSDMILLYYAQNFSFYYIGDMKTEERYKFQNEIEDKAFDFFKEIQIKKRER